MPTTVAETPPGLPRQAPIAATHRLRIGVVGARTRRQGIGEHVARHFAALGHQVTAIAASTSASAAEACEHLQQAYGIAARGYVGVEALLEHETLDALAICSPDRFHRQHLALALASPVHILCEKPLVFEPGRDPAADAAELLAACQRGRRVLMVNEQWPYTLPSFAALHPEADERGRTPESIAMWLSPSVTGAAMIPNAVPHLLSLVWRLCPAGGEVEQLVVRAAGAAATALDLEFNYRHLSGTTRVSLTLRQALRQPRPAGYAIDGRVARRVVEMSPYGFFLETGEPPAGVRRVRMPDPLALLAREFAQQAVGCRDGLAAWQDATLLERLRALGKIARAADETFASCAGRSTDEPS